MLSYILIFDLYRSSILLTNQIYIFTIISNANEIFFFSGEGRFEKMISRSSANQDIVLKCVKFGRNFKLLLPLMWFFMTHCLMLQRSRDDPNAWLSHEPQCSTRTSHFIRYAFNVKTFIFRNTLCKWFEYSCDIYCLRLNQKNT